MASSALKTGIFVAVDSGGTRTNVAIQLIYPDSTMADYTYEIEESLSGALPSEMIATALRKIAAPLEEHISNHESPAAPVYVWISAAGFTPWTRDDFARAMHEVFPTLIGGRIKYGGAANDGVSLLLVSHKM